MKEFRPSPWIPFPRYIETLIQLPFFILLIFIAHNFGIKGLDESFGFNDLLITALIFFAFKILGTFSAVDLIIIDSDNKKISFTYWFLYVIKKRLSISFEELDYKNRHNITILGGSLGIYFYKKKKLKIKLNRKNGWKDSQIDVLIMDLLTIKPPISK